MVIIHAGASEIKADNEQGFGLYFNESETLKKMYKTIKTPFGDCYVLDGNDAEEYMKKYRIFSDFSAKRREIAFKHLFKGKVLLNKNHQGMLNMNEMMLGCHYSKPGELLPLSIKEDSPSYLVKAKANFTENQIDELGFRKRAEKHNVIERLRKCNISPHGGGYDLVGALRVQKVHETPRHRFFEIETIDGIGKMVVSDLRSLPYTYRSREIAQRSFDIGFCEKEVTLIPAFTLKI
jgi:hypothetical protein